jgi:hypothetical protein
VAGGRKGAIEADNICAVHLPQPARLRGQCQRTNQQIAVRAHNDLALSTAQTKIERVERRLRIPGQPPSRDSRANLRRCGPVGHYERV